MSLYTSKISTTPVSLKNSQAFSLVEMIVSMAIFSIVAVIALGALTKIIASNRKAQSLQSSITNLNFMLDSMSRELRVGAHYTCKVDPSSLGYKGEDLSSTTECPGATQEVHSSPDDVILVFKTARQASDGGSTCNLATAYRFTNPTSGVFLLGKAIQHACQTGIEAADFSDVVDPNVTITGWYLKVATKHYSQDENTIVTTDTFPLVTIGISGYAGIRERDKTYFSIQTAVSPRISDF